jgi:ligand-binding sensor domain-containing protein/two-component sensor histidine kinase
MKTSRFLLLVMLAWFQSLHAQQGFTFNRISTEDGIGLASNVVYCMYQDPRGFIWVGTANGLQRFDGSKFVQFSYFLNGRNQLQVSDLTQMVAVDSSTLLLAFTNLNEFSLFNTRTYQSEKVSLKGIRQQMPINNYRLWKDSKGEIFLSVLKKGLFHYNKKTKSFSDDHWFPLPKDWETLPGVFEDPVTHFYWFPGGEKGLAVYDPAAKQMYTADYNPLRLPLLDRKKAFTGCSEIFIDSKRRYWVFNWVGGNHFKNCYDSTGKKLPDSTGLNYNPDYTETRFFFETRKGLLWTYGANALYNYDAAAGKFYYYEHRSTNRNELEFQFAYQMMEDHDGNIWMATDNGLYFTNPVSGTNGVIDMLFYENKHAVDITDVLELAGGQRWLSVWGSGVITLQKDLQKYDAGIYRNMPSMDPVRFIQYRQAWALYQHTDGKIWIGCQGGRYMIYDTLRRTTEYHTLDAFKGATFRYITGDKQGNIWMGSVRGTLVKYDGKQFTVVQELTGLITKILIDQQGDLWVAAQANGLYHLSPDGKKIIRHYTNDGSPFALFANNGKDIEELDDSTIVFGAGALNFIDKRTGHVHWLGVEEGLPGNTIQRMRIDANGYLWMITLDGLCRYNPINRRITPYGKKDGVTVANLTYEADYLCSDGQILFAGSNALLAFQPQIFQQQPPRDVVITDFKLFSNFKPVDSLLALPRIQLQNSENTFTIYFTALSYQQREKLTYYYRLVGLDESWTKADRQHYVNFNLLPPGHYTFEVYCEDIDGNRSPNISSLSIYIKPPFWRTYWFLSTLLFFILLAIYGIHRMRVNRLLAVEKIRNRVARDLHDDMGSTLSTINILSSMAKSRMHSDPVKTTEYLGKISDNSQRMMDAMDDIVWSIKPSNDSMQKIAARMREFAVNVLEAKEIEMDFRIDEPVYDVKLNMEARRDFFLLFKEAVNNAAKYSKADMVTIQLGLHNQRLVLVVADNGTGFDPDQADGNGMGNMQKRADALHGRLQVVSTLGKGTRITLNIPVSL